MISCAAESGSKPWATRSATACMAAARGGRASSATTRSTNGAANPRRRAHATVVISAGRTGGGSPARTSRSRASRSWLRLTCTAATMRGPGTCFAPPSSAFWIRGSVGSPSCDANWMSESTAGIAALGMRPSRRPRTDWAAITAVDSLIQFATQEGLPTDPLIQKALEGGAKHVPGPRIVAAVQVSLSQLRDARDLLVRAGDPPPVLPAEMTTVAWARRRGLAAPLVERVVAELARPPRAAAMHAVADLVAHGFDPDSAAQLIIEAVHDGVPQERLLEVSTAALQQVQRGHTRAEALAIVRGQLPNLPASARPPRGNVAGARRPASPAP